MHAVVQHRKGMLRDPQRWDHHTAIVEQVLNRVHAQAAPRAGVVALMVQAVHVLVDRLEVLRTNE